jgi:secreted PhoX family phosphatase
VTLPHRPAPRRARPTRRDVLGGGAAAVALLFLGRGRARAAEPVLGFREVAASDADAFAVPEGYEARVLFAWGDPVVPGGPAWDPTAAGSAADQALQAGMHHDGMHLFPAPGAPGRFLLAVNHEYTDEGLLHPDGVRTRSAAKVEKSQNAHGVSIVEIERDAGGRWRLVDSPRARRITARTPMRLTGPAAGSPWLATSADPEGRRVLGTMANCAAGRTPWGTYLTCEENFQEYFARTSGKPTPREARYGIEDPGPARWHEHDPRFLVEREPNECHRFGWVVEIDPADPASVPEKRTALGRFRHENAFVRAETGSRAAVYLGDDAPDEFLYKFVSDATTSGDPAKDRRLLDEGTLHVARWGGASGRGEWVPLRYGERGIGPAAGFGSQAEVLVFARAAASLVGATPLDRPEWVAMDPRSRRVFVSLTKGASDPYGRVLAIDEDDARPDATSFRASVFAQGGPRLAVAGSPTNDAHPALGCPDGLFCDPRGVLWIQTDVSARSIGKGSYEGFGNNQMVAVDPATLEARRFLVGPRGCEITGIDFTPDLKTLFVNVQHPGESRDTAYGDPDRPAAGSSWPTLDGRTRPRSATVVVQRLDGREIGA